VAVVGVGRMGGAMAATLRRAGFEVVVWNRDAAKAERVAGETGARVAATAAAAAGAADVVITSLADDAAVRAAYLGPDGVAAGIRPGAVALDTSTVDPETQIAVGAAIDAAGAGFLDCPVSGDVSRVHVAGLTIMVGGDPALLERVRPVLEALAARIVPTGVRGSAAATKLAVNALVHGINVALSEAVVLAERAGVDRAVAYEVFASGAGGAPYVHYKRAAFADPDTAPVAFSIDLVAKDLRLITHLGERVGAPMRQAETGLDIVNQAIAHGYGERDLSAIAVFLRAGGGR
jgi:3-hydroxyisobutyrate dehydrogenase/2-hydroxy-3-oxopropionate reductase